MLLRVRVKITNSAAAYTGGVSTGWRQQVVDGKHKNILQQHTLGRIQVKDVGNGVHRVLQV